MITGAQSSTTGRIPVALLLAMLLAIVAAMLASCSVDTDTLGTGQRNSTTESELRYDDQGQAPDEQSGAEPDDRSDAASASADDEPTDQNADRGERTQPTSGIDPTLSRSDDLCIDPDDDDIGSDRFVYTVGYQVVDGTLGAPCFGLPNEVLEQSWLILGEITPPDQLRDLAIFGGFRTPSDTLAFVTTADQGLGSLYEMSINLETASNDLDELLLTLAHEFSHVFTATPNELDRDLEAADCDWFHNGEGCYLRDSLINGWVEEFWPQHIADFDADDNPEDDVVERCAIDPGFFGSYGATNPEEDFAESFAAYVMRVPAAGASQQARIDWIDDQPGLREFRDRAMQFGYGPLSSNFDECGFAS